MAQIQVDFEKEIPAGWKAPEGGLSLSGERFKSGVSSLRWDWKAKELLSVSATEEMAEAFKSKGLFTCWIYNERPVKAPLMLTFSAGGAVQYMFNFNLNYSGWRACRLNVAQMLGDKADARIEEMQWIAPRQGEGTLFIDRLSFLPKAAGNTGSDAQMPFLSPEKNDSRWMGLWHRYANFRYDLPVEETFTPQQKQYTDLITARIVEAVKGNAPSEDRKNKAKGRYDEFRIKRTDKGLTGRPIVMNFEKQGDDFNLSQAGSLLLELARVWHHTNDRSFIDMYMNLLDHLIDQGFDIGSHLGSSDLYGYNFRDIAPSMLLMRPALESTNRLEYAARVMGYWADLQLNRKLPQEYTTEGYCDIWNTQLPSKVIAVALMPDRAEKWREFELLSRWTSYSLLCTPGTFGGIKPDGTVFHHWGIYMGYAVPAFNGLGEYVKYTNHTPFQLTDEALANFGNALLQARFFMKKNHWGFAIYGRSPMQGEFFNGAIQALGHVANAGEPFTQNEVWKELAEAYLRLGGADPELTRKFLSRLVSPEASPQGNRTYNYAAMGVHRRDDWMVMLKAYNKHAWSTEIYSKQNRYGRYISYGSAQIVTTDSPADCGFREEGWDWNRFPGTTTIHLPWDLLDPEPKGTVVILSPEELGGASHLENRDGLMGVILQEPDRPHFTPSFRAYKSVFCFDNVMVFLGSGISNENKDYPTETTLFQYALNNKKEGIVLNDKKVSAFPFEERPAATASVSLSDPAGNHYFVPGGNRLVVERKEQSSVDNKQTGETKGNFATAYIDHGKSPQEASYHYSVLVQPSEGQRKAYADGFQKNELPYKILKHDNQAHIVQSTHRYNHASTAWTTPAVTTAYILFEPATGLDAGFLSRTNSACFVMIREAGDGLVMSVCHPHLNLPADKQDGTNERAIYHPSQPLEVEVELKGKWSAPVSEKYKLAVNAQGNTVMRVTCVDGIPVEMELKK